MANAQSSSVKAGTAQGIVLLMAAVMPIMAITSLVPVLPVLLREFSDVPGSEALVPIALTIPALCVALFSPLAGWLSDRVGRKPVLVTTLALYAVTGILPWFLTDLFAIIASRIGLGIMEAAIMTISTAMIADYYVGEERERWISLQVGVGSVAAVALVAMGGILGDALGSRGPFLLYLSGLVVALIAAFVLFEPQKAEREAIQQPAASKVLPQIWPLLPITFGVGVLFYVFIVQIGPILEVSGELSSAQVGIAAAVLNTGVMVGSLMFKVFNRGAGSAVLAIGLCICALGYAGAGSSQGFVIVTAFATLGTIGAGILLPNMITWTLSKLAPEVRGRGTGIWTGSFFLAQFVAPLAFGAVVAAVGGINLALLTIAAAAGIAAVLTALLWKAQSPPEDATDIGIER